MRPSVLLDIDLASECLELINVLWTELFFDRQDLDVELFLFHLGQKRYKELGCPKNLRLEHAVKESLVVRCALY